MNPDVKLAFDTIRVKQARHTEAFDYYDGNQPLIYAHERLRQVFDGNTVSFIENWCAVVIDSCKERIELMGFFTGKTEIDNRLGEIWQRNEMSLETDDLHEAALVAGEAYLMVWQGEDGKAELFYNDPRLVHVFYDAGNSRKMRMAAKLWVDDVDERYRLNLYYPERIEYFESVKKASDVTSANAFVETKEKSAVNPYGEIPVFHFRLNRRRLSGDLHDVIPIQNGANKLFTDMMVAAEFGAFRQRYVISNADIGKLKNSPNEIWGVPAGDGIGQQTQVGEFSATELGNYLSAIDQLAGDIAKITRTPKHYFFSQGGQISGEALIAMEAPLDRKVKDRVERFDAVWRRAMAFALRCEGVVMDANEITPQWERYETIQPKTQAEIRYTAVQTGLPLRTVLRREGWTEDEIAQMEADKAEEGAEGDAMGKAILNNFDKGQ